ncbi:MAG TPA: glutamate synthase subunit alpha, partial [Gammaproteobacteria bacterium]|nr:glutamate synthase subunit alpha [Gammaproteobacteria bacterium]
MTTRSKTRQGLYDPAYEHDSCGVGLVAHIKGVPSRTIVDDAYMILKSMEHRAGVGAQPNSGDGAGILTALPYDFLARVVPEGLGVEIPVAGALGVGLVFLPQDLKERAFCKQAVESLIARHGQQLIGWRVVPVAPDAADLGTAAKLTEPYSEQLLVSASPGL